MKFKSVLIASDFDGTLKNDDGVITPDVIEKIKYFIENGGLFTICTGRIHQGFHLYSPEYINAPVLVSVPLCIVFSSFLSTLGSKNSGWINGTITALLYFFVVYIVRSVIVGGVFFDLSSLFALLGFAFIGTVGGIAGILVTQIVK